MGFRFQVLTFIMLAISIPMSVFGNELDSMLLEANELQSARAFDQAYQTYERLGQMAKLQEHFNLFIRCRVEMARCSQFTSVVSRDAIGEIILPAITLAQQYAELLETVACAEAYQFLARYHWSVQGAYPEALQAYDESLKICDRIGEGAREVRMASYNDMSHVYSNQEQFDQALDLAKKSLELSKEIYGEDGVQNGPRYYSLGFTYYRSGDYDRAIEAITKGISILESGGGPEMQIGLGYNNLSAVYVAKLDQEGALQSTQASEQILGKYLEPNHEAFGNIQWDLALMYADLGNYVEAENHARKAISIFESRFGPKFPQLPDLYHHLGYCLDQRQEFDEALSWHQAALAMKLSVFGADHVRTSESHRRLALHFLHAGQIQQAEKALAEAFLILDRHEHRVGLSTSWLYDMKGMLLAEKGAYKESAEAFDRAISGVCIHLDPEGGKSVENSFNPFFFTEFQEKKARVLFHLFQEERDIDQLVAALAACRAAHGGIRKLRLSYRSAQAKLFLQKRARSLYDLMLQVLYQTWKNANDPQFIAEAWEISEQTKSLLLLEERKRLDLDGLTLPSVMYDSLTQMQRDLAYHHKNLMDHLQGGDSLAAISSRDAYFQTNTSLAVFENDLQQKFPDYAALNTDLSPITLPEVQQHIPTKTALIEYYLGDSALIIFCITQDDFTWHFQPVTEGFQDSVIDYARMGRDLDPILEDPERAISQLHEYGKQIAKVLLPDTLQITLGDFDRLIIVPDRELAYLSFEALPSPTSSEYDYLIDHFATCYAYSGSLYAIHSEESAPISLDRVAGFAPSYPQSLEDSDIDLAVANLFRSAYGALPGAKQEVLKISELTDAVVWLDSAATEENFKEVAPKYDILHMALHGMLDEESPILSRLLFHRDSVHNGELNAYEIYDLDLDANLAVLSACNTASGRLEAGEGILSLSRAFAFAGVPNLIASLWRADDDASGKIMVDFYRNLQRGLTKDEALRGAKLDFLRAQKSETYRHPYFWAAYVLIGENISAVTPSFPTIPLLGIGLLLLGFFFYWFRLR